MTALNIAEEAAQLDLLPRSVCLPRSRAPEIVVCGGASASEPLDRPLRRSSLDVLFVIVGLEARRLVATTRVVARALRLPDTESATRNLERTLRSLSQPTPEGRAVLAIAGRWKKARGRPSCVWTVTPAGRAELILEHERAHAEDRHRAARAMRRARARAR